MGSLRHPDGSVTAVFAARRDLVHALERSPGPWGDAELRQIRRLLRDPAASVWEAACGALGARVESEFGARRELLSLLSSEAEEVRLRGLQALGHASPEEAVPFLQERVFESASLGDAVMMDAAVGALASLSPEAYDDLVRDRRDAVRSAAAAHLPAGHVDAARRLARDRSVEVRVALAATVGGLECDLPDELLWHLAADPDPLVRQTLAEELPRDVAASMALLAVLASDADPLVRASARPDAATPRPLPADSEAVDPWGRARALEAQLDASPSQALEILRPLVLEVDGGRILARMAETARDADLAALCRSAGVLWSLGGLPGPEARARMLEALGALPAEPRDAGTRRFREFLAAVLRAAEAGSAEEILDWSSRARVEVAPAPAQRDLARLARIGRSLEPITCASLSAAAAALDEARLDLSRDCPEPERSVLRAVLEAWSETFEHRIAEMLTGAMP